MHFFRTFVFYQKVVLEILKKNNLLLPRHLKFLITLKILLFISRYSSIFLFISVEAIAHNFYLHQRNAISYLPLSAEKFQNFLRPWENHIFQKRLIFNLPRTIDVSLSVMVFMVAHEKAKIMCTLTTRG